MLYVYSFLHTKVLISQGFGTSSHNILFTQFFFLNLKIIGLWSRTEPYIADICALFLQHQQSSHALMEKTFAISLFFAKNAKVRPRMKF